MSKIEKFQWLVRRFEYLKTQEDVSVEIMCNYVMSLAWMTDNLQIEDFREIIERDNLEIIGHNQSYFLFKGDRNLFHGSNPVYLLGCYLTLLPS